MEGVNSHSNAALPAGSERQWEGRLSPGSPRFEVSSAHTACDALCTNASFAWGSLPVWDA